MTPQRRAELALLLVTALWGVTFPVIKLSLEDTGPFLFLVLRCGFGALLLWPLMRFRIPSRSSVGMGVLLGGLQVVAFFTQTAGLQFTTATRSAFITGLSVVIVPVLYPLWTRRRPERWPLLGAGLAVAGLYEFTNPEAGGLNRGDVLTLACAAVYAVFIIVLERATRRHPFEDMLVLQMLVLAVAYVPGAAWEGFRLESTLRLWTGVASTGGILALTLYLLSRFQRDTTATRATVIYTAEPVFAAAFAFALLGETLAPGQWLGAAAILGGILVSART